MSRILAPVVGANLLGWGAALWLFRDYPALFGTALLAYGLGLRHAVDADHIAAIDNVTRKLMRHDRRPLAAGLFFALGHSTVVVVASVAIAASAGAAERRFDPVSELGGPIGGGVSALFLFAIGVANTFLLASTYRTLRRTRQGQAVTAEDLSGILWCGGIFGRLLRPLFRVIGASWQMYPLGFLFGLGFDTATEIGLLGIAAAEASKGLSIWSILIFPALFTAGMSLVDTVDGLLMLRVYEWAFVNPVRTLYYNLTITAFSVCIAAAVGGIECFALAADKLALAGPFWQTAAALGNSLGEIGFAIIAVFATIWLMSFAIKRIASRGSRSDTVSEITPPGAEA